MTEFEAIKPIDEPEIFLIDDEKDLADAIPLLLNIEGIENKITVFYSPEPLLDAMHHKVRICIVDYMLNNKINGLELIQQVVKKHPHCFFIMLSAQDTKKVVIEFMNSVYGSRYVDKGSPEWNKLLAYYVKDLLEYLDLVSKIYSVSGKIIKQADNLEKLIEHGNTLNRPD